ncbi:cilia- and flagella-associated protein 100-like [Dendronephthya gigantea]|uniref:cilia- and flagella-associated protein 100-like n=1 Tax=Dendronephthya gigantea TaxID=151771 RepID=UPI00106C4853|nr:cilia- and flagella-associated protein 100-like [Dendronephthya gigantea]XP_028414423.1 cilia- and flagella-associated protein 100-like [Dendronephthya gigantea]
MSAVSRSTASRNAASHNSSRNRMRSRPNSTAQGSAHVTFQAKPDMYNPRNNPFRVPMDNDIFTLREKERDEKLQQRKVQHKLKVHEKTTYASRVNAKTAEMRKIVDDVDDEGDEMDTKDEDGIVKDDPQFTLAITRDRNVEKENLSDFIAKKREMFLVQYSLGVKRDEMRKLEEIAQAEEKKLELAEQYLEEDAQMFDEFLKENDKNSVDAIKIAENETKIKLEKVSDIKKINAQMMAIKSEISKNEDTLKDYMLYKQFLDILTPPEFKEKERLRRLEKQRKKAAESQAKPLSYLEKVPPGAITERKHSRHSRKDSKVQIKPSSSAITHRSHTNTRIESASDRSVTSSSHHESEDESSDEEPELYFTDPQQLLDIFTELEEQNLSLIQNSQETEEALEELKQTIEQTKTKMDKETEVLKQQISLLKDAIYREQEKSADLEMKSKMFSYGEFKAEDQEQMLKALNKKVEEVYRNTIGDNEANISTLQMLTNIENRLEELFEQIEMMPPEKVELAEKAKEKERRMRQREEKLEAQRIHQEERVKRALERARADPKKKTGRKLMFRSEPPQTRKKEKDFENKQSKEEEELQYFFS